MTLRPSLLRQALLFFIVVVGAFIGLPNPYLQFAPAILLVPAGLYLIALSACSALSAFRQSWLAAGAGSSCVVYWVAYPVHVYGQASLALAVPCALLVGTWLGLFGALFAVVCHCLQRITGVRDGKADSFAAALCISIAAGCGWAVLEAAKEVILTGFPWATLASAFVAMPVMLQLASVVGGTGLGALLVCAACLLTHAVYINQGRMLPAVTGVALLGGIAVFGHITLSSPLPDGKPAMVSLIQGNINQDQKWLPEYQQGTADRYLSMSQGAVDKVRPDLLVWPETSMPFYYQEHALGETIREELRRLQTPLLLGTPGYILGNKFGEYSTYNRAYLVSEKGKDIGFYDKEHLVPFGEYIPPFLELPFLRTMMQGVGDFTPGTRVAPLTVRNLVLGILICYESIFSELAQQRVAAGATVLINISNDAWFGDTSAPYQHLQLTAVRAVEQGRYIARCTNTGISAIIDPYGRIVETGPLFKPAIISGNVLGISTTTIYHTIYEAVVPALLLLFCLALAGCVALSRRHKASLQE
ncbi:apolipoprotein N-acyltransferase [Oleidesulfovibrio sp.]|uniref:apolipoprotein N-acyltransferase n=1 Tax=Oleidesulfovibrio sp. TaxID=2909707 RepID=UPI003A8BF2C2